MDTTASSFTLRKNAKRAAEAMIRKGVAPAVDYGIKLSDDGRFEIVWKLATSAPTTDEVETEIAQASADQPAASAAEKAPQPAPAATKPATTGAAPGPASEAEIAPYPTSATTDPAAALSEPAPKNEWPHGTRVMVRNRKSWREATIISRLDPDHWRAEYPGGGSGMFREVDIRAYDPKRDARPAAAATKPATTGAAPGPASEAEIAPYPTSATTDPAAALSEPAPKNEWPHGTRVMVRNRKSWREATIISRLDPDHWRAEYPGGGSGMFREVDIRAYDPKRDARPAAQSRRAKATAPQKSSRSRYAIDPEAIGAGRLPQKAPVVTSAANPHYQKHFDRLFALARAGDWDAVRDYKVTGSNSYSKMVARYRQDLLAVHAASEAVP